MVDVSDPVWDIALIGTNAVVALGRAGIGLVDISVPNPSVLIPGSGITNDWATRVRTVGNRVCSNRGTALRVRDLTGALTFANVATVDAGDWVTDIAVMAPAAWWRLRAAASSRVTAGGLLEKARHLDFPFLREVRLAGNIAFVAASDQGLAAIEIGNLAAAASLGSLKFTRTPIL
jgi:hypothetical protein